MRLAIVGIDGVGKTTLSSYLSKELDIPVFKDNMYKEKYFGNSEYVYHSNSLLFDLIRQTNQDIILDRCFWDEYVYGSALGRQVDCRKLAELDNAMSLLDFSIVYLTRPNYIMSDDKIPAGLQSEIEKNYQHVMYMTNCKAFEVYMNFEDKKQTLLDIIIEHYK